MYFLKNYFCYIYLGALTLDQYSFKGRSWELQSRFGLDITDSLLSKIRLDFRELNILRILSHVNENEPVYWLTDKTRFHFLSYNIDRLFDSGFFLGGIFFNVGIQVIFNWFKFFMSYLKTSTQRFILFFSCFWELSLISKFDLFKWFRLNGNILFYSLSFIEGFSIVNSLKTIGKQLGLKLVNLKEFTNTFLFDNVSCLSKNFFEFEGITKCFIFSLDLRILVPKLYQYVRLKFRAGLEIFYFGYKILANYKQYNVETSLNGLVRFSTGRHQLNSFLKKDETLYLVSLDFKFNHRFKLLGKVFTVISKPSLLICNYLNFTTALNYGLVTISLEFILLNRILFQYLVPGLLKIKKNIINFFFGTHTLTSFGFCNWSVDVQIPSFSILERDDYYLSINGNWLHMSKIFDLSRIDILDLFEYNRKFKLQWLELKIIFFFYYYLDEVMFYELKNSWSFSSIFIDEFCIDIPMKKDSLLEQIKDFQVSRRFNYAIL